MDINYMNNEELAELLGMSVEEIEQMDEEQREAEEFFEENWDDIDEGYAQNSPCDTWGTCSGRTCPVYFHCQCGVG